MRTYSYHLSAVIVTVAMLLLLSAPKVFADAYPTNWTLIGGSYENVYMDSGVSPRLHNANDGYLENTVTLPREDLWEINFSVKADGDFNHPDDYVKVYINSELVVVIPNIPYGSPLEWVYPVSHMIEGDSFTYRFEMHSYYPWYHAHQQIQQGTITVAYSCDGFEPPMDYSPVSVKKNRTLPLKIKLFKHDGSLATDLDIVSPPVLQVNFISSVAPDPVDVSYLALPVGQGSTGNIFTCNDEGLWHYNLKMKNYNASGTYLITIVSGDSAMYSLDCDPGASFVIDE